MEMLVMFYCYRDETEIIDVITVDKINEFVDVYIKNYNTRYGNDGGGGMKIISYKIEDDGITFRVENMNGRTFSNGSIWRNEYICIKRFSDINNFTKTDFKFLY